MDSSSNIHQNTLVQKLRGSYARKGCWDFFFLF